MNLARLHSARICQELTFNLGMSEMMSWFGLVFILKEIYINELEPTCMHLSCKDSTSDYGSKKMPGRQPGGKNIQLDQIVIVMACDDMRCQLLKIP